MKKTGSSQIKTMNHVDGATLWRFHLPPWITTKALELSRMRAMTGWDWVIRTYNEIPSNAKVFASTFNGDIQSLQELFSSGQASPFDRARGSDMTLPGVSPEVHFILPQRIQHS